MTMNRRQFMQATAIGAGALVMPHALGQPLNQAMAAAGEMGPRRFVFIRKSSGIRPLETALVNFSDKHKKMDEKKEALEVDLDSHELPLWLRGLDEYKANMTILQGLSAKMSENIHWSFSSVMGCFKSQRNTLSAIKRTTIDYELAKLFPSPFGHVELSFAENRTGIVDGYSAPAPYTRNYCYAATETARSMGAVPAAHAALADGEHVYRKLWYEPHLSVNGIHAGGAFLLQRLHRGAHVAVHPLQREPGIDHAGQRLEPGQAGARGLPAPRQEQ